MLKKEIFDKITDAFTEKYSWLGKQFSEEFLYSVASHNIQTYSQPEFRVRRHLILFWQPAWLKCLEENQLIATSNGYIKLANMPQNGELVSIENGFGISTEYFKSQSKTEECNLIKTSAGYEITAGRYHPFMVIKPTGELTWVTSEKLKSSDVLVMARPILIEDSTQSVTNIDTARLIGYLIGDGSYCSKNRIGFCNSNPVILADFLKLAKLISTKPIKKYARSGSDMLWINDGAAIAVFKQQTGLDSSKAINKSIPERLIVPNKTLLENLLFGLYQTDGSIRTNGISFTSTSQVLLKQIQHILLMLGCDSHRIKYEVRVYGYENLSKLSLICNESKHKLRIAKILARRNPCTERVWLGSKIILRELASRKGKRYSNSIRKQLNAIKYTKNNLYGKTGKGKNNFANLCSKLDMPHLLWLVGPDIFFDKVKTVANVGKKTCYDLCVPATEQFISNGFLTHNSTLLGKAYKMLSPQLCTMMSDVSLAALRGTVESGAFVSPFVLKRPFSICTEFGQIVTGSENNELVQKLLNVLEEGTVNVSLGKIAYLSKEQKEDISNKYGITFIDNNTFLYNTNWILIAGTYNKKFLVDNAFESRFNICYPNQKLDNELTKHVNNAPPFLDDEELYNSFRTEIVNKNNTIDTSIKLPNKIFENGITITPRDCATLKSYILCRSWWNIDTSIDELTAMLSQIASKRDTVWKSADDKVFDSIENTAKSVKEIADDTGYTTRQVYYSLKTIRATKIIDEDGDVKWKIL